MSVGEDVQKGHEHWRVVGKDVEASWGADWWQAKVKRIKAPDREVANGHVLACYVGGAPPPV